MKKRKIFLSILLALCLVVTLLPVERITSFATETATTQETTETSEEEKKEEVESSAEIDADEKETDIEEKSNETVAQEETSEVQESNDNQSEDSGVEEDNASDNETEVTEATTQSEKDTYSLKEEKSKDISEDAKTEDSTKDTTKKKCDSEKEDTKEVKSLNNIRTLRVTKVWLDDFNRDGIRPKSVTVQLYQNGKFFKSVVITAATAWTYLFCNLPVVNEKTGKAYVYTVTETPVKGYIPTITADLTGYNIVNTHIPEKTKVSVSKVWADNNDQDGKRPESIQVQLKANGIPVGKQVTLSEKNNWNYVWKLLPKNKCGKPIVYTVEETKIEGYEVEYVNTSDKKGTVCTITNTHIPEETAINVNKKWVGDDEKLSERPESITVELLANGQDTDKTIVLTADNDWKGSFVDLPKYEAGTEITYSVEEISVDNYESSIKETEEGGFTITNTYKGSTEPTDPTEETTDSTEETTETTEQTTETTEQTTESTEEPTVPGVIPSDPTVPETPSETVNNETQAEDDKSYVDEDSEEETPEVEEDEEDTDSTENDYEKKDSTKKESKKTESKKTGDSTPIGFFVTVLLVAVAGILWVCFGKERRIGKHNK